MSEKGTQKLDDRDQTRYCVVSHTATIMKAPARVNEPDRPGGRQSAQFFDRPPATRRHPSRGRGSAAPLRRGAPLPPYAERASDLRRALRLRCTLLTITP